jgi:hypothetical protein
MGSISYIALLLGSSWASGVNLYLTVALLGVAHRLEWLSLPGQLEVISNPLIIGLALILFAIEFVADKIPYVDSAWDAVHTFIRPFGGALLGYLSVSQGDAFAQTVASLVGGSIAFDSHLTKASTRVAINASPEPFSNSVASITEDVSVLGAVWLILNHPVIMIVAVIIFILISIWLIPKLFRLFKKVFGYLFGRESKEVNVKQID